MWLFLIVLFGWCAPAACAQSDPPPGATAPGATDDCTWALSPFEEAVLKEINVARTQPQVYATYIASFKRYFSDPENPTHLIYPGWVPMITREGVAALDEAIAFLEAQAPLPPLTRSRCMSHAARDHADVAQRHLDPAQGHIGNDGISSQERMEQYTNLWVTLPDGTTYLDIGDNINLIRQGDARDVIMAHIVDDGIPDRGHRYNLFLPDWRYAGIGCWSFPGQVGDHHYCVQYYSAGAAPRDESTEQ